MKRLLPALALLVLAACGGPDLPEVPPRPDVGEMEPAVRAAIEESYDRLAAEPSIEHFEDYARVAQTYGLTDDAVAVWESLMATSGTNFKRAYLAGRAVLRTDPDRARRHFEAALEIDPSYDALNICMAELLENADEIDRAEKLYRAAAAGDRSGTVPFALGRIAFQRGNYDGALKDLEAARRIVPEHRPLLSLYAQTLFRLDRTEEAQAIVDRLGAEEEEGATMTLKISDPIMSDLYQMRVSFMGLVQRAEAAVSGGAFETGARLYEQALKVKPDQTGLLKVIGQARGKSGDLDGARKAYRDHLAAAEERDSQVVYALGLVEFQLRNIDEGIRLMNEVKRLEPDNLDARMMLATALWNRDPRVAVANLRYILLKDPGNNRARTILARIHFEAGRIDEGKAELDRIFAVDPNFAAARELEKQFLQR